MTSPTLYAVGQTWRCTGRTADETPKLLIQQIDTHPLGGLIYHVSVEGLRIRQPALPGGLLDTLPHVPVTRHTLDTSVTSLEGTSGADARFREGHAQWKQAFDAQQAGAFGVSVAEIATIIERGIAGAPAR